MARLGRAAALRTFWNLLRGRRAARMPGAGAQLAAVPRMVVQGLTGRYPHLDTGRLLLAVLGLVYVVSPVDAVPEAFLLVLGLGDDALVAAWVVGALLGEVQAFLEWEADGRPGRPGRVVVGEVVGG